MIYESAYEALRHHPTAMLAGAMLAVITERFALPPCFAGEIGTLAYNLDIPTIDFHKPHDRGMTKLGHLYPPEDIELYGWLLFQVMSHRPDRYEIVDETLDAIRTSISQTTIERAKRYVRALAQTLAGKRHKLVSIRDLVTNIR